MKVRIKRTFVSRTLRPGDKWLREGEVVDLPKKQADQLIMRGFAEAIEAEVKTTEVKAPAKTTAMKSGRKRKA